MKKINITFCSFPDFSGNAKSLFKYIRDNYKNKMNYTWIVTDERSIEIVEKEGARAYLSCTKECDDYMPKTDIFFTTHANLTGEKEKCPHAIYIELWHGIGPKPVGYLAKNMLIRDKKWYAYIKDVIDYVIVPSEFWRIVFSSTFDINVNQVKALGLPLLDDIINSDGRNNLSSILDINIEKYNKIIFYMPTFRKGCGRSLSVNYAENSNSIFNFENYDDNDLINYLHDKNYLLVIKRHPSDELKYKFIENENIKNIDNNMLNNLSLDVNNILNAADLLITDYSSIGTEFLFLDKPVIYISTDLREYYDERGIILDNYDFWTDGITCDNYKDMIGLIDKMINKKYVMKNKKLLYNDLTNGGCREICDFVFDGNRLSKYLVRHENRILKLENENKELTYKCNKQLDDIKKLTESDIRLKEIEQSRSWQMLEKFRSIKRKFR